MSFVDRVAVEARKVKFLGLLLWVLAAPFYVLGVIVGVLWVAVAFAVGAVKVGIADFRSRAARGGGG